MYCFHCFHILRPGTAPATVGTPGLLRRLLPKLWQAYQGPSTTVQLDRPVPWCQARCDPGVAKVA
jgi:hypothetical protein